jgi:ABC-type antimicrobial peptide transport system permease subunit
MVKKEIKSVIKKSPDKDKSKTNSKNDIVVNIGLNERCFRIIVSLLLFSLALSKNQWFLVLALLFLVTGIVGWSPSYQILRINTNKKK